MCVLNAFIKEKLLAYSSTPVSSQIVLLWTERYERRDRILLETSSSSSGFELVAHSLCNISDARNPERWL
jgi:hypothetical protein